jgi:hypothetical protein
VAAGGHRRPDRAAQVGQAVVTVGEPPGDGRQAAPRVAQRQPRPLGQVAFGRRAVTGQVAGRQFGERTVPVERRRPPWPGRGAKPVPDQRVGVLAPGHRAPHSDPAQARQHEQVDDRLALRAHPRLGDPLRELGPGERPLGRERAFDDGDPVLRVGRRDAFLGEPPCVAREQLRRGERVQPPVVLGPHQVQRAAVQPGHHHGTVPGQGVVHVRGRPGAAAGTHRQPGPALVLRLHGEQMPRDLHGALGRRAGQQLRRQPLRQPSGGRCRYGGLRRAGRCHIPC